MENKSEELWENRLHNQMHPLIGTNLPGEGNGFHDRVSFDTHYHLEDKEGDYFRDDTNWLHSVYFRDLNNMINPQLYGDRGESFQKAIQLEECSVNYKTTFEKYVGQRESWNDEGILETISLWSNYLVHNGRVIVEVVGWYDNETQNFYGFELKLLNLKKCELKSDFVYYTAPDLDDKTGSIKNRTVKIPKEKCIIIDWPQEIGGFSDYRNRVHKILNLGSKYGETFNLDEQAFKRKEPLKKMQDWDLKFKALTSFWGTMADNDNTTAFYRQYDRLKLKGTVIHCLKAIVNGLNQLVQILNTKLEENATLFVDHEAVDLKKYSEMKATWLAGKASFEEVTTYLSRN